MNVKRDRYDTQEENLTEDLEPMQGETRRTIGHYVVGDEQPLLRIRPAMRHM